MYVLHMSPTPLVQISKTLYSDLSGVYWDGLNENAPSMGFDVLSPQLVELFGRGLEVWPGWRQCVTGGGH